ncbi:hypothetical protein F4779DRAFT_578472 [Xylariaceae sp. FL0662B]|nr:hypothetical protein F4779DRAFT_578472 [Xylariaceae sp. FL0662B]
MESPIHERKEASVCDPCRVKKIRCDRERPCCSNCRRVGQPCSWTGHGKKPSQNTTLTQSLEILGGRFERVESVVREMQRSLEKLQTDRQHAPVVLELPRPDDTISHSPGPASLTRVCDLQLTGPPTLQYLAQDAERLILNPYCKNEEVGRKTGALSARDTLRAIIDGPKDFMNDMSDDVAPQMPPLDLMPSMIEPYCDYLSPRMPLWTRSGISKIMSQAAGEDGRADRAIILCVNNLLLLALGAKCRSRKMTRPSHSHAVANEQNQSPMELVFLETFLQNARRALNRREQLLSPSLRNIQALLSLCLVAQQHWDIEALSCLYHQAAYLARCTGLDHLSLYTRDTGRQEDFEDSLNALNCLCVIGSSVNWVSGYQPLCSFTEATEAALALAGTHLTQEADEALVKYQNARLSLVKIEDRAFASLYPVQFPGQTLAKVQQDNMALRDELDNWWSQYGHSDSTAAAVPGASTELQVRYHTMKVLLTWPSHGILDEDASRLGNSRACLRLLVEACGMNLGLGCHDFLVQLVVSYPPVAFYDLLRHTINYSANDGGNDSPEASALVEHDLHLLQTYVQFVQQIPHLAERDTYVRKLAAFQRSLAEFASAHERHATAVRHQVLNFAQDTELTEIAFDDMFDTTNSHRDVYSETIDFL